MPASRQAWLGRSPAPRTDCPGRSGRPARAWAGVARRPSAARRRRARRACDRPLTSRRCGGCRHPGRRRGRASPPTCEVRDVGDPEHVGRLRPEAPFDEVVGDADAGHPDRRPAALAGHQAAEAGLAHQSLHALARDADPVREPQVGVDPRRAVDAPVVLVDLLDPLDQPRVRERPVRRARLAHS